jgi:hypothetical protein
MDNKIRLKDLELVAAKEVDIPKIMKEIYGYKNKGVFRAIRLRKLFPKVFSQVNEIRALNVTDIVYNDTCSIKKPKNIDRITYSAMMRLNSIISDGDRVLSEVIADIIATTCFSEHFPKIDFDSDSMEFKEFKNVVSNSPLKEMFGLYNTIHIELKELNESWQEKFFSVEVKDEDYEKAGGQRMNQFNVINTIKKVCLDFNVTDNEAWQKPFFLVQVNNYEAASKAYTQDQMSKLKEIKMRSERDRQSM